MGGSESISPPFFLESMEHDQIMYVGIEEEWETARGEKERKA